MFVHLVGVGSLVGVDDVHLAVAGHDLHTHARELVQDVLDSRGGLLPVEGRAVQHRLGGKIIQQRAVAGDGRQRKAYAFQRCADRLRRAAGSHGKQAAQAGKEVDDRAVAGRQPLFGGEQRVIHITDDKGIA